MCVTLQFEIRAQGLGSDLWLSDRDCTLGQDYWPLLQIIKSCHQIYVISCFCILDVRSRTSASSQRHQKLALIMWAIRPKESLNFNITLTLTLIIDLIMWAIRPKESLNLNITLILILIIDLIMWAIRPKESLNLNITLILILIIDLIMWVIRPKKDITLILLFSLSW